MTKLILWGIGLLIVLGLVSLAFIPREAINTSDQTLSADSIRAGEALAPVFTPQAQQKLKQSNGFQALAAYTDGGFEPMTVSIHKGETVRFSNNSSHDLQVMQKSDEASYGAGACDTDAFAECVKIAPRDFWEFTFMKPGTWTFVNALNAAHSGVVQVQ